MSQPAPAVLRTHCPTCRTPVSAGATFCEACGSPVPGVEAGVPAAPVRPAAYSGRFGDEPEVRPQCLDCGGAVGDDDRCTRCGAKAPSPRDHYVEHPSSWVAASCDRGLRHEANEDATAVASDDLPGTRAVLVVCDGVSTTSGAGVASLAAARRARDVLVALHPGDAAALPERAAVLEEAMAAAVEQAGTAVVETTTAGSERAACTLAAVVLEGDLAVFANVGDTRVYWLPDAGTAAPPPQTGPDEPAPFTSAAAAELSLDDSVAQARIAMGVAREDAEHGPQAHAITKWLGRDSPDASPRTGSVVLDRAGWVLVCTDGLWNYASSPDRLQALVGELAAGSSSPLALAEALVRWANDQGGRDNVSVALARH